MKRFILNSPKFQGNAEIHYNGSGVLCKIDLTNCLMEERVVHHFKAAVPSTLALLLNGNAFSSETSIVEAEYEITFDMLWNAYSKKHNRIRCEKLWKGLSKIEQIEALHGIVAYDKFLKKETWRSKADPETYLRNQMWNNEWK
jgi:hypothetical protein